MKTSALAEDLRVYVVTDRHLARPRSVSDVCLAALGAGVRILQLREKNLPRDEVVRSARDLLALTRSFGARLVINDDPLICAEVHADGVHLGRDDMPAERARKLLGPGVLIGVSVREPMEARAAEDGGADYVAANLVFTTATKTNLPRPIGLEGVSLLRGATMLPLVAIGGITAANAADVIGAGADAVAVVSAVMSADDVEGACAALFSSVRKGLGSRGL
jgi:thiamine-phosphate pyrophosphorylase